VQCSDQVPKAAVTYKQWSLDSKVYALEVLDRLNGSWSRAASLLRDMQPVTYRHIQHTHLQYWSKQWSEGTVGGGKKKAGTRKVKSVATASERWMKPSAPQLPLVLQLQLQLQQLAGVSPQNVFRGAGTMWRGGQGSLFLLHESWDWNAHPRTQVGLLSQIGMI
jgi:hypothetical protein